MQGLHLALLDVCLADDLFGHGHDFGQVDPDDHAGVVLGTEGSSILKKYECSKILGVKCAHAVAPEDRFAHLGRAADGFFHLVDGLELAGAELAGLAEGVSRDVESGNEEHQYDEMYCQAWIQAVSASLP